MQQSLDPRRSLFSLAAAWAAALALGLGMAAAPALAQEAEGERLVQEEGAPPTELQTGFDDLIEVSEVFVDVLATDPEGQVVRGLGIDDFIALEDGEPVQLTGVSYYSTQYGDRGAEAGEVPSSRYLVFFLHDQTRFGLYDNRLFRQQLRAVRDARRWVREERLPSDWMAVVSYSSRLQVFQDFTQDGELLEAALQRAAAGKKPEAYRPDRRGDVGRGRQLEVLSELPAGQDLKRRTENVYGALETVADALGPLVGRKTMILYTIGFGVERNRSTVPDERYYPQLETALNDHNVAVYPVDLTPAGYNPRNEDFLTRLAEDTGGYYDPNFLGFLRPLRSITAENVGYYLLTYRSARPAGEVGYQRFEVRAKDPEIEVRARTGYRYGR
ncbi:MAG: VWA domain-containing protein [Acidobacteriota bacterium]